MIAPTVRPVVRSIGVLTLTLTLTILLQASGSLGGYLNSYTFEKGDTIHFFISTQITPFTISISKFGAEPHEVAELTGLTGGVQAVRESSYYYGCAWRQTAQYVIPDWWETGLYIGEFPISSREKDGVIFIVRERHPGSFSRVVSMLATSTWQAYNYFGGKSIYDFNSTVNPGLPYKRSFQVSMNRPLVWPWATLDFFNYVAPYAAWLDERGYKSEWITNIDLDHPDALRNYDMLVILGHDEYWSMKERRAVEKFIASGHDVMILAGNVCYWQVRWENNHRTMVCYKDSSLDPLTGNRDSLVTVRWANPPVNMPEAAWSGAMSDNAGYCALYTDKPPLAWNDGYGDYAAYHTEYWVFDGTGLRDGDEFGYDSRIVGYETDGAQFRWVDGLPEVTGANGTPLNYRILGVSPAVDVIDSTKRGHATMGIFRHPSGGWVFNAATVNWAGGLWHNPQVQQITANVFERFVQNRFPPEITVWHPSSTRPYTVNRENSYRNFRDTVLHVGDSLHFHLCVKDFSNDSLSFRWKLNGSIVGADSCFEFRARAGMEADNIITGYVYNSVDTALVWWYVNVPDAPMAVRAVPGSQPKRFWLAQNYPNPFNPVTTLSFTIAAPSAVRIDIVDLLGGVVETLVSDDNMSPGEYTTRWDGSAAPSGIYMCRIEAVPQSTAGAPFNAIRKLVLLK